MIFPRQGKRMRDILTVLSEYIEFFPLVAIGGLLLAGINLPVSEDLIIITGAFVSHEEPSLLFYNLAAIFVGVIATDFFVYWVGTKIHKGASKSKFFSRLIPEKAMNKMHFYLDRYGIFTFIVCRFIPFGVRNTLFMTSGFIGMEPKRFALYDIPAATISVSTLFFLVYRFGKLIEKPFKIVGSLGIGKCQGPRLHGSDQPPDRACNGKTRAGTGRKNFPVRRGE
jgi:membrane protein DedA with SNARE-associated domain